METLTVKNLNVCFFTPLGEVRAVKDLNFSMEDGKILALVGESGSGKTITALTILRLLPFGAKVTSGEIIFEGKNLLKLSEKEIARFRGRKIVSIPQDPGNALNPIMSIGSQLQEALSLNHFGKSIGELLNLVKIPDPEKRARMYPHELSGGMKQRVLIAMALAGSPEVLIADEPTTALDVTVQVQILDLLQELTKKFNFSTLFITHNLGIVAEYVDKIVVMKKGEKVEENNVFDLFSNPQHEYTRSLIEVVPRLDGVRSRVRPLRFEENILKVDNLNVHFVKSNFIGKEVSRLRAVDGVSFCLKKGESIGLVGESGCGKTTIARSVLRVVSRNTAQISGKVEFEGKNIFDLRSNELLRLRKNTQLIIQENVSALNPRKSVGEQIAEVFKIHNICKGSETEIKVKELMDSVGVFSNGFDRFPAEFSSGERQRLVIARAVAVEPKLLFLDEPVASLDVSVQAKILELLGGLKEKYDLTYLFISHDLSVVREMCHRILVMYLGKIVEIAESKELVSKPIHPYTQALISAVPIPDPVKARAKSRIHLPDEPPSPMTNILGCKFHTRCSRCLSVCKEVEPILKDVGSEHLVACHLI